MKILYDHQIFTLQNYGGISRYFCEMINQFSKNHLVDLSIALRYTQNENLLCLPQLNHYWTNRSNFFTQTSLFALGKKITHRDILHYLLNNRIVHINQQESERLLKKHNFNVFHPTYYNPYFLKHLHGKPYVITVYDMIHEIFPEYIPPNDQTTQWKKSLIGKADAIIAISESTKQDIIKYSRIDPNRIHVIHLGNPFEKFMTPAPIRGCPTLAVGGNPYLMFVGNRGIYKNFLFFIKAISQLLKKENSLQLLCSGGGPFTTYENTVMKKLGIRNKVHYIQPNDATMKNLYENAQAFIFPSLYEGFGLPILEAFSCGCPTIMSNISSLPEIGGNAAIYFDPRDSASLTNSLEQLLSDDALRMQLITRGYERLKIFSWEKTTNATKKIYEDLLNQ